MQAAGALPADKTVWRREMTETVKLALPIALTQLVQIAMMTSDLALIADSQSDPAVLALDLLAQAEHGPGTLVVGISTDWQIPGS